MLANKHQAGASVCRMITAFIVCSTDDINVFRALEVTWYPYDVSFKNQNIFDIKIADGSLKYENILNAREQNILLFGIQQMYLRQFFYITHTDIKSRSKYSVQK